MSCLVVKAENAWEQSSWQALEVKSIEGASQAIMLGIKLKALHSVIGLFLGTSTPVSRGKSVEET